MSEKIKFTDSETNEKIEFSIVEQTRINNTTYILVTEDLMEDEEEQTAYILKDLSEDTDEEANYVILDEDDELDYVSKIFAELLEDIDIEK